MDIIFTDTKLSVTKQALFWFTAFLVTSKKQQPPADKRKKPKQDEERGDDHHVLVHGVEERIDKQPWYVDINRNEFANGQIISNN